MKTAETSRTITGALAVGKPRNFIKSLRSLRESNGIAESVTDDEILEAQSLLARIEGIFGEPGGVAPVAGMIKLIQQGLFDKRDRICCVITGNGLKDRDTPLKHARKPNVTEPTIDALRNLDTILPQRIDSL